MCLCNYFDKLVSGSYYTTTCLVLRNKKPHVHIWTPVVNIAVCIIIHYPETKRLKQNILQRLLRLWRYERIGMH